MNKKFENKVVWITGGGSGLGKAYAIEFAQAEDLGDAHKIITLIF